MVVATSSMLGACQDPAYRGLDASARSEVQCAAVFRHAADNVDLNNPSAAKVQGFDPGNDSMRAAWFEQKLHARRSAEDWRSRVEAASDAMDKMTSFQISAISKRCAAIENADANFMQLFRSTSGAS